MTDPPTWETEALFAALAEHEPAELDQAGYGPNDEGADDGEG